MSIPSIRMSTLKEIIDSWDPIALKTEARRPSYSNTMTFPWLPLSCLGPDGMEFDANGSS